MIALSEPALLGNEWKYVRECLDTNWISSAGKYVQLFEEKIRELTSATYAIATINGTAALHIALLLSDVEAGDEVIVPTLTFIAPINAIRYTGAHPVFMDCEPVYFNLDVKKLKRFLQSHCEIRNGQTFNLRTGRIIKAIIPVHIFGAPCEMDQLIRIASKYRLKIIEDATESVGSTYKSRHTGTIGYIGCLSFNGNKIITTGGGGMVITSDPPAADKARYLTTQAKDDTVHYVHNAIGYNYRLSNIAAAIGVAQLEKLEEFISLKHQHAEYYRQHIEKIKGLTFATTQPEHCRANFWLYTVLIDPQLYGRDRDQMIREFNRHHIQTRPIWKLNHTQKPYIKEQVYEIKVADRIYQGALNIPSSVTLTRDQMDQVISVFKRAKSK